ncbi:DUF3949 domain-containing protein [Paenibacillus marinisediminis]
MSLLAIAFTVVFIYLVIMVPIQYSYLIELRKQQQARQNECYDQSSVPEQMAHDSISSNSFFKPANLIASWIIRLTQGKQ